MGESQTIDDRIKERMEWGSGVRSANKHEFSIEVAKIWDEIENGRTVLVDEDGKIVESEDKAECELRPDPRKRDEPDDMPVIAILVGRPEDLQPGKKCVKGGTVYANRNGMVIVHRTLNKDVLSEDDALDGLLDAMNYCDSVGHHDLSREIGSLYQRLGAIEYGVDADDN